MMMNVLIVDENFPTAGLLREMIELDQIHLVTAIVSDLRGALKAIDERQPEIALIDLHLGGEATGIEVAVRVRERDVPCLFMTATPLPFPVPELALGCLCKPYNCYSVAQALSIAEKIIGGMPRNLNEVPYELELY